MGRFRTNYMIRSGLSYLSNVKCLIHSLNTRFLEPQVLLQCYENSLCV